MYYRYKLTYYDEFGADESPDEGIVYGETYSEAMRNLEEDYGTKNIDDIFLTSLALDGEHTLNKEDIKFAFQLH